MSNTDQSILGSAFTVAATLSKDPSTQVGAVAVDREGVVVSVGQNHIPLASGIDIETCTREEKYACVVHAEVTALLHANSPVHTLYVTWFACQSCAAAMIAAGVRRAVTSAECGEAFAKLAPSWTESVAAGHRMLRNAGVEMVFLEGPISASPILIGGKLWNPENPKEIDL